MGFSLDGFAPDGYGLSGDFLQRAHRVPTIVSGRPTVTNGRCVILFTPLEEQQESVRLPSGRRQAGSLASQDSN